MPLAIFYVFKEWRTRTVVWFKMLQYGYNAAVIDDDGYNDDVIMLF